MNTQRVLHLYETDRKIRISASASAGVPFAAPFVHHHLVPADVELILVVVRLALVCHAK